MYGRISQQNRRVVSLKLLELTEFAWPNLSVYLTFLCADLRHDVIESTRFVMRPPVIIPPCSTLLFYNIVSPSNLILPRSTIVELCQYRPLKNLKDVENNLTKKMNSITYSVSMIPDMSSKKNSHLEWFL